MLTLYHCHDARSFRPLWTLEEMGLPYELKMLPFPPRVAAPDYLDVNPLGTIPTFFDGDMRMTESVAICQYLVSRYGQGILLRPATSGGTSALWVLPVVAGVLAAGALGAFFWRRRRVGVGDVSPDDRVLVEDALAARGTR